MASTCEGLRRDSADIWEGLHSHPFIAELADGSLPEHKFAFFVAQDLLYLREMAKVMAIGAAKADDERTMAEFVAVAAAFLNLELPRVRGWLREMEQRGASGPHHLVPANLAYTSFLLANAYRFGPAEILASVTPCTWSYGEIARQHVVRLPDHPVYRDWLAFFSGPEYGEIMDEGNRQLERSCAGASSAQLALIGGIFRTASRLERSFWDMAYHEQDWPI